MASLPPGKIAINHDEYHARHIGHTADGRQFILTTPFEPAYRNNVGGEFVALYLFDSHGKFLEAKIDSFGPREKADFKKRNETFDRRLSDLGDVTLGRIEVEPFEIKYSGISFGLIPRIPEEPDDVWAVEFQPGNYMAFFEPWDSGDYDT